MKKNIYNFKILTGSCVFFENFFPDFQSHDRDYIILKPNKMFKKQLTSFHIKRIEPNECYFCLYYENKEQFLDMYRQNKKPTVENAICEFLTPEIVDIIGLTIDDLKTLEFKMDLIDERHLYLKYIYYCYLENNDFVLTDEQRKKAYEIYKQKRKND